MFLGVLLSFNVFFLFAEEGLWPLHVDSTFWKSIQVQGIKLDQKDIFQEGGTSLEDAVIRFGNGCSGILVSENGLVMTNYHCALRYMERITTEECDYLSNGFWAEREKEMPIAGLSVRLLSQTLDVTDLLCKEAWKTMSDKERKQKIQEIERQYTEEAMGYEARIVPVYSGNQYYLYQYQVFKDIRLVGAPPLSLGKFGKDVDNWMWPRHTADFALFRIYAGHGNSPASYSPENVPYQPKKVVPISLEALKEGDFTFVLGYPGSTDQYKHSEVLSNLVQ
ncbi:S46 family peptidase, partial [Parabacteroides distasonis]|uniref:S46 family peptidase n=1 Tax=Parabacteroides distasonis TaxID=823 RepID=UPI0018A9EBD6